MAFLMPIEGEQMPYRPKRPCSYPGCSRLTDGRYCEEHTQIAGRQYNKYQRDPDTNQRYGRAWRRIRARYIQAHPLCEQCQSEGRLTPAEEVHHILPLADGAPTTREISWRCARAATPALRSAATMQTVNRTIRATPWGISFATAFVFVQRGRVAYKLSQFQEVE